MQPTTIAISAPEFCWKTIGIQGDRSCAELPTVGHCRNCQVYSRIGRDLLNRPFPQDYPTEWAMNLAQPIEADNQAKTKSLAIFRLQNEWFALSAEVLSSVTTIVPIRHIPQRSNGILLGLVNIQGELQLAISLAALLGLGDLQQVEISQAEAIAAQFTSQSIGNRAYARMVLVQLAGARWVFAVDDIYGIERFGLEEMKPAPANVTRFNLV
jgi:chemotaxis-related protein WspD